jgi:phage host-nuclease inhibitor protein Gam
VKGTRKYPVIKAPKTFTGFQNLVTRSLDLDVDIKASEAEIKKRLKRLRSNIDKTLSDQRRKVLNLKTRLGREKKRLAKYLRANEDLVRKNRSEGKLTSARLNWLTRASLRVKDREAAIAKLEKIGHTECLKITKSLKKQHLKDNPEIVSIIGGMAIRRNRFASLSREEAQISVFVGRVT